MSSSEGVSVAVPLISGYSQQQNGDLNSNSSNLSNLRKDTANKLPSGLENPFIKNFGRKFNPPPLRTDAFDKRMSASWSSDKPLEDEDVGEYKPGSGFVNKLRNKFLSQSSRDDPPFSLKKSASVEDLLNSSERVKSQRSPSIALPTNLDEKAEIGKPLSQTSKTSKWARSVECLTDGPRNNTSHQYNLASSLQIQHRTWEKEQSKSVPKSPRDIHNHIIAPDVGLARDDIIIIEKTPDVSELSIKKEDALSGVSDSPRDSGTPRPLSYREEFIVPEELPKHNTVVNIRSLFEMVSHTTPSVKKNKPESLWHIGRSFDIPESPPAILSPASTLPNDNDTDRPDSVTSPRLNDNDTQNNSVFPPPSSQAQTPVLLPSRPYFESSSSQRDSPSSSVSFKSIEDKDTKDLSSKTPSVSNASSSRLSSESSSEGGLTSPRVTSPRLEGTTFSISSDDSKPSSTFKSSSSSRNGPRNTASVKPIVSSKKRAAPTKPSKPSVPLPSAPASAATSYKRSSPVVSVAPFKNQQIDKKTDSDPVMIFDNSKMRAKKRAERTKDYTPLDNDEISKTEVNSGGKKITVTNISIRGSSKGPSPSVPDTKKETQNNSFIFSNKNSESAIVTNINNNKLSSNYISTEKKENKKPDNVAFQNNDIILERKSNPAPSPRTKKTTPVTEKSLTEKSRTQVTTPINEPQVEKSRVQTPTSKVEVKVGARGSMIYISSGSEASESEATPPVTPRSAVRKTPPPVTPRPTVAAARVPPSPRGVPPSPRGVPPSARGVPPSAASSVIPTSPASPSPTAVPEPVKGVPSFIANRLARDSNSPSPDTSTAKPDHNPSEAPIKGIPSFLANRLKQKEQNASQMVSLSKDVNSSTDSDSFSPRNSLLKPPAKREANDKEDISNSIQSEIAAVRQRMGNRSKATDVKQIFDSSSLKKKREENKRLKEGGTFSSDSLVPRLDLTDLDKPKGLQSASRQVQPCSVTFINDNVKTSRNLLKKQRKVKINIRFNETPCEMFEYPTEDHALEMYLDEHPDDTEDIIFLEPFGGGESGESDDADESHDSPPTPRGKGEEELLRTSPAMASAASGNFQSYMGRFSEEFVFGSSMTEPEPPAKVAKPAPQDDPESMMLRPAEEVDSWGANQSSDLMF